MKSTASLFRPAMVSAEARMAWGPSLRRTPSAETRTFAAFTPELFSITTLASPACTTRAWPGGALTVNCRGWNKPSESSPEEIRVLRVDFIRMTSLILDPAQHLAGGFRGLRTGDAVDADHQ